MEKIYHYLIIKAPVSNVFEAITTINGLKSWWTTDTSGNPLVHGEIRFGFGSGYDLMTVIASEKNKLVTWEVIQSSFPQGVEWIDTQILFELS